MLGWVAEQRAFYEAYVSHRAGAARQDVKILWWTVAPPRRPDAFGTIARLWSGRPGRQAGEQVLVAVFAAADPVGAPPFLVVRSVPDALPRAHGRATATVVGRPEPGGALVIETSAGTVLPIEPPGTPGHDAPSWSEVDAPA